MARLAVIVIVLLAGCGGCSNGTSSRASCPDVAKDLAPPTRLSVDPIALASSNEIANLPAAGEAPRAIVQLRSLRTPEAYLADAPLVTDAQDRIAVMRRDGFRTGVDVEYGSDNLGYSLFVLRFRDQAAALDYLQAHLTNICAISRGVVPLRGVAGVAYVRSDNFGRATFVAGDSEISVCGCRGRNDEEQRQISADWAQAIAAQLD
jgi:hypothetical protein